jgi:hypothetical protein
VIYGVNRLEDPRWTKFRKVTRERRLFTPAAWLAALRSTYGYQPVKFTPSPPTAVLANAIVFCKVKSWLTGRRLVSLPFSDHSDVLMDAEADIEAILPALRRGLLGRNLR